MGWLASKTQRSTCLSLSTDGITNESYKVQIFKIKISLIYLMCMSVLLGSLGTTRAPGTGGSQQRALFLLELELQIVEPPFGTLGIEPGSFARASSALDG